MRFYARAQQHPSAGTVKQTYWQVRNTNWIVYIAHIDRAHV